jgi:hypothetical protein
MGNTMKEKHRDTQTRFLAVESDEGNSLDRIEGSNERRKCGSHFPLSAQQSAE